MILEEIILESEIGGTIAILGILEQIVVIVIIEITEMIAY